MGLEVVSETLLALAICQHFSYPSLSPPTTIPALSEHTGSRLSFGGGDLGEQGLGGIAAVPLPPKPVFKSVFY